MFHVISWYWSVFFPLASQQSISTKRGPTENTIASLWMSWRRHLQWVRPRQCSRGGWRDWNHRHDSDPSGGGASTALSKMVMMKYCHISHGRTDQIENSGSSLLTHWWRLLDVLLACVKTWWWGEWRTCSQPSFPQLNMLTNKHARNKYLRSHIMPISFFFAHLSISGGGSLFWTRFKNEWSEATVGASWWCHHRRQR